MHCPPWLSGEKLTARLCSAHMIPLSTTFFLKRLYTVSRKFGHYSLEDAPEDVFTLIAAFVEGTRIV